MSLRLVPLPEGYGTPEIEALYTDGMLEVIAPAAAKALEPPKPKSIPVKTTRSVTPAKKVASRRSGGHP